MNTKKSTALIMAAAFMGTTCFGTAGTLQASEEHAVQKEEMKEEAIETTQMVNPYLPLWEHIPDGEPRVFEDPDNSGKYRVYIYGSHDSQKNSTYCGYEHVVWSAPVDDLSKWRYEGESYNCGGLLYAPDVVEKDGKYYLYTYDLSHGNSVAVSDRPAGPFKNMGDNGGHKGSGIGADPAILVDDDGKMYAYWGYQTYYQAEIDPKTMAVKPGTTTSNDITSCNQEGEFQFYEGASIRKVDGKYVMVYCQKPDKDPENGIIHDNYRARLAYAYSDNPLGPWTYGGPIIDNGGELLTNGKMSYYDGNVHGGIMEIQDQWYVFYHRMTNQSEFSRQAMMEPLEVSVDSAPGGKVTIKQAEMTSQGAAVNGLNAYNHYDAGIACYLTEGAYITTDYSQTSGYNPITNLKNGCVVGYKYMDFGEGVKEAEILQLALNIKTKGTAGKIDIFIDDPNNGTRKTDGTGTKIGSIDLSAGGSGGYYTERTAVKNVTGKHALFFVFSSDDKTGEICEINGFQFSKEKALLQDEFEAGLERWNASGNPSVAENVLSLNGEDKIVSKDGENWTDYLTEVKVTDGDVRLEFRRSDDRNFYTAELKDETVKLSVTENGKTRLIKSGLFYRLQEENVKLSVSCAGSQIAIRVNGTPVLVTNDKTFGNGGIALGTTGSATIDCVTVLGTEVDNAMRTDHIYVNGEVLSGFQTNTERYSIALEKEETIPTVAAFSTDENVRVSVTQAKEIPGAAVVKFLDDSATKTYVIDFYRKDVTEYDFTKGAMPDGWSIVNPKDTDKNVIFGEQGVTIKTDGADLPSTPNQLQLDEKLSGDYQVDTHAVLSEPLHNNWAKYGMTIYEDDKNMVILDHEHDNRGKVQILWWKDGKWITNQVSQDYAGKEIYFRLIKIGNNFECLWSEDGTNYNSVYTAETDGRFEEALLHLFASKQNVNNDDFTVTYDKVTVAKLGQKAEIPTENSELENLALQIGSTMTVPTGEYADTNAIAEKAEEMLKAREDVNAAGAEVKVEAKDNRYTLTLNKEYTSVVTAPFFIEVEKNLDALRALIDEAKKIQEETCTVASWNRLVYAVQQAENVAGNEQATAYDISEAYDILKATMDGLEFLEDSITSDLSELIDYAKSQQSKEEYKYVVPVVKEKFEKALADAEAVNAKADATQEEIDAAYAELLKMVHYLDFTGNSESLKVLVDAVKGLNEKLYTPESWNLLKDALTKAEGVLSNENALQDEIDAAKDALQKAMDSLVKIPVDKSRLQKLVNDSKKYEDKLDEYTKATAEIFAGTLKNAKDILSKEDATQKEVNAAYNALQNAIFGLRLIPDKDKLNELIKEAEKTDFSKYTKESGEAVKNALQQAKAVLADENATEQQIAKAENDLKAAMDGLKIVSNDGNANNTGADNEGNGTSKDTNKKAAKTGDVAQIGICGMYILLSGGTIEILRRKRKK